MQQRRSYTFHLGQTHFNPEKYTLTHYVKIISTQGETFLTQEKFL